MRDEEIGGVELEISIKFNKGDERDYLDKVTELQNKVTDSIESLGHDFIVALGKPILKSELE